MSNGRAFFFAAWVFLSLTLLFTVLLWQPSTGSGLNLYDLLLSLPTLIILIPLVLKMRLADRKLLYSLVPLLLYISFGLSSLLWADNPDSSKAFRGAVQILTLFMFFSYLHLSGREALLRRGLLIACCFTAVFCLWHLLIFYGILGQSFSTVLYQGGVPESRLNELYVDPINAMLATLIIVPQAAMLLGLLVVEKGRVFRFLGLAALFVLIFYLIALERRTAQVSFFITVATCLVLFRNRLWFFVFGGVLVGGGLVFAMFPETILSRGFSWRPEIWMATFDRIMDAPIIGHGITNTVVPVVVTDDNGAIVGEFRHPHNMALSVTYNLGLVGLVLWVLLWLPGLLFKLFKNEDKKSDAYITLPMVAGGAALVFDGGAALSPLHHYWFCFWVPTLLMLSHPQTSHNFGQFVNSGSRELEAYQYTRE